MKRDENGRFQLLVGGAFSADQKEEEKTPAKEKKEQTGAAKQGKPEA